MTKQMDSLQNKFLVAMPVLTDFNFNKAVVYICAHNNEGAMGVIINHPLLDINLGEILLQMNITPSSSQLQQVPVLLGGPLQSERGFILHRPNKVWDSTLVASADLALTSSQDILKSVAKGEGPDDFLMILGCAGWNTGQLEKEIVEESAWLVTPADPNIMFGTPFAERWPKAAQLLGVDVNNLSTDIGHA